jgi:hypothetical protein
MVITILGYADGALRLKSYLSDSNPALPTKFSHAFKSHRHTHIFAYIFDPDFTVIMIDKVTCVGEKYSRIGGLKKDKDKVLFIFIYKGEQISFSTQMQRIA